MFDQTPPHTLDKIMAKLIPMKNNLKLDLQGPGHSKKQKINIGNKNRPPLKKLSRDSLVTDGQLICQQVMNDLLMIIKVGQKGQECLG